MINWTPGRQDTGYFKKTIAMGSFWDVHLLKFPTGSYAPQHTDLVPGKRHYRLNIILGRRLSGGSFVGESVIFNWCDRVIFFRSDSPHMVTHVWSGTRYLLSFGFALAQKSPR